MYSIKENNMDAKRRKEKIEQVLQRPLGYRKIAFAALAPFTKNPKVIAEQMRESISQPDLTRVVMALTTLYAMDMPLELPEHLKTKEHAKRCLVVRQHFPEVFSEKNIHLKAILNKVGLDVEDKETK